MNKKLRLRILEKLAQTTTPTPAQPETAAPALPPPSNDLNILFSHLNEGYNSGTVPLLQNLTQQLNMALHYASHGKDNFDKIRGGNLGSPANPDSKSIGMLSSRVFNTFLNHMNSFNGKKVDPATINNWADAIISSPEFGALSQITPTGPLATKLQFNLKPEIQKYMTTIKNLNPVNQ